MEIVVASMWEGTGQWNMERVMPSEKARVRCMALCVMPEYCNIMGLHADSYKASLHQTDGDQITCY